MAVPSGIESLRHLIAEFLVAGALVANGRETLSEDHRAI
jgi:hypothetical protein